MEHFDDKENMFSTLKVFRQIVQSATWKRETSGQYGGKGRVIFDLSCEDAIPNK